MPMPARDALDFGAHQPLDQARQILVEPGFEHRAEHFAHQVFQGTRVLHQDGLGQRVKAESTAAWVEREINCDAGWAGGGTGGSAASSKPTSDPPSMVRNCGDGPDGAGGGAAIDSVNSRMSAACPSMPLSGAAAVSSNPAALDRKSK